MIKEENYYQSILQNSTLIIKVSGKICDDQKKVSNVVENIQKLLSTITKLKVVLVFGFGRQLDNYIKEVHNKESTKLNGRRVTTSIEIEAAKKISGQILIDIFSLCSKFNIRSFPIPIAKKDFIIAKKREVKDGVDFGLVGDVSMIDALEIQKLFKDHDLVVMPSLVLDKNNGDVLNVNADTIAKELAVNLKASKLVFISDVPFVKNQDDARISVINDQIAQELVAKDIIKDGMIVKVENALDAVNRGVDKVHIISGGIDDALLTELETEDGIGTVFQSKDLDY